VCCVVLFPQSQPVVKTQQRLLVLDQQLALSPQ